MHALQQTNKRKRDSDNDIDDDKKVPSSPGIIISDHMIIVMTSCDMP